MESNKSLFLEFINHILKGDKVLPHITELTIEKGKEKQEEQLYDILKRGLQQSWSIVVIFIKPNILQRRKLRKKAIIDSHGILVLSCKDKNELQSIWGFLQKARPWHISNMKILIGESTLPEQMAEKNCSLPLTIRRLQDSSWIDDCGNLVIGSVEPLDDDLIICGIEEVRRIIGETLSAQ
jgi:hypothetical protein